MFEFINQDKVTFFLARASQIFPRFSPSETCALPFDFRLERDQKNISHYQGDVELYGPGP